MLIAQCGTMAIDYTVNVKPPSSVSKFIIADILSL
jgi:hypothetical protein